MAPSESTISPISTPIGAHTPTQAKPIKTAPRMCLSHFAIATFTYAPIFYHQSYYIRVTRTDHESLNLGRIGG